MRPLWLACLFLSSGTLAAAGPRQPVLLELFTSQGCSSCPPAEALFEELDQAQPAAGLELIPLVFHVDYWDRLGWKDPYADQAWTRRQYAYASAWNTERIYTPQAVVNGTIGLVGHDRQGILAKAQGLKRLDLERREKELVITGLQTGLPLWVALTEDGLENAVPRGENKGRKLKGHAVVRLLRAVSFKDKTARWDLPAGSFSHAVAWQQDGLGAALSAGRLALSKEP